MKSLTGVKKLSSNEAVCLQKELRFFVRLLLSAFFVLQARFIETK